MEKLIFEQEMLDALKLSFWRLCEFKVPMNQLMVSKDWCSLYCTSKSIAENFEKVFGYRNDGLASRFYNLLAEGQFMRRIYLPNFIIKLRGLVEGGIMEMNMFSFLLVDGD